MTVITDSLQFESRGEGETRDITAEVQASVERSGVRSGIVSLFVPGSTAALTTIEYEAGAVSDFAAALECLAPRHAEYRHNQRWGDMNGFSHVRAALLGPSLTVPFADGKLLTGTWQQIVLVDFDNRSRRRRIICQIMGE